MVEKTLVFVKPDGVERGLVGSIITRFENRGFKLLKLNLQTLSSEMADKHYEEHVEKGFYPNLKSFITRSPIAVMVFEGENAIETTRLMIGVTDSAKANPGTIRGDYSLSKGENLIHASDSPESAAREIKNFFPDL